MIKRVAIFLALCYNVVAAVDWPETSHRGLQGGNGDAASWIQNYSVKYTNCFRTQKLVSYRMCPTGGKCHDRCADGADYIVELEYFIDLFTELHLERRAYQCEMIRENCQYESTDTCYQEANMNDCINIFNGNNYMEGFNLQEYTSCTQISDNYYVGPYCGKDHFNIYLGVFSDNECTTPADVSVFKGIMGYDLPYAKKTIIPSDCASCKANGNQDENEGNEENEDYVLETCESIYADTQIKCESGISDVDAPDATGCGEIESIQRTEGVANSARISKRQLWLSCMFIMLLLGAALFVFLKHRQRRRELMLLGLASGPSFFLFNRRRDETEKAPVDTDSSGSDEESYYPDTFQPLPSRASQSYDPQAVQSSASRTSRPTAKESRSKRLKEKLIEGSMA